MGWSCQDCVNSDLWVGVQDCMICGLEVRIVWSVGWRSGLYDLWVGGQDCMICGLEVRIVWSVGWRSGFVIRVNAPAKITKAGQRLRSVFKDGGSQSHFGWCFYQDFYFLFVMGGGGGGGGSTFLFVSVIIIYCHLLVLEWGQYFTQQGQLFMITHRKRKKEKKKMHC